MKMIQERLEEENNIFTIWFDAWKYERESNLTIIPLLRSIYIKLENIEMSQTITKKIYRQIISIILKILLLI